MHSEKSFSLFLFVRLFCEHRLVVFRTTVHFLSFLRLILLGGKMFSIKDCARGRGW